MRKNAGEMHLVYSQVSQPVFRDMKKQRPRRPRLGSSKHSLAFDRRSSGLASKIWRGSEKWWKERRRIGSVVPLAVVSFGVEWSESSDEGAMRGTTPDITLVTFRRA